MKAHLKRHGKHPNFNQTETLQIEKRGGKRGEGARFYVISRLERGQRDPMAASFCDLVDALGMFVSAPIGEADVETLAFPIPALGEDPSDWGEVAGYPWNGASIEQVAEEILRNEEL